MTIDCPRGFYFQTIAKSRRKRFIIGTAGNNIDNTYNINTINIESKRTAIRTT